MADEENVDPAPDAPTQAPAKGGTAKVRRGAGAMRRGETGKRSKVTAEGETAAPPAQLRKPSTIKKLVFFSMPVLALALVAGGFFVRNHRGENVWVLWLRKFAVLAPLPEEKKPVTSNKDERTPGEIKYDEALIVKRRLEMYVQSLKRIEENDEFQTPDKLSEIVKELERGRIQMQGYMDHLGAMAEALADEKGTTEYRHIDNLNFNAELQKYQKYMPEIGAHILKWKEIAKKKGLKFDDPPVDARPAFKPRLANVWGRCANGSWVRHRVIVRAGADDPDPFMQYKDTMLKNGGLLADKEGTIATQRFAKGEAKEIVDETVTWEPDGLKVGSEESLTIGATAMKCTVVEVGAQKSWYAAEGRGAGKLLVKRVDGAKTFAVTSLAEEQVEIPGKNQKFNCIKYEADESDGTDTTKVVAWVNEDVPGGLVKMRRQTGDRVETTMLVDRGSNWEKRPEFPKDEQVPKDDGATPPKPEPPKEEPKPEPPKEEPKPEPKPEPPKEEPKPEPRPEPKPEPKPEPPKETARQDIPNPWAGEKVGAWFRLRSSTSGMEIFIDTGLAELGADYYVTVTQNYMMGKFHDETRTKVDLKGEPVKPVGSENVDVGGTTVSCDVYEISGSKTWVVKEGDYRGALVRMESPYVKSAAKKLGKESVSVKGRSFDCVVVEAEQDMGGQKSLQKTWTCATFPLSTVKMEGSATTMALVDHGDDWSKRPTPETAPKEEPKPTEEPKPAAEDKAARAQRLIDEADALLKEATPAFKEVKAGADAPPADAAARRELVKKADACEKKLYDAQLKYTVAQPNASDPEKIKARIKALDSRLADLKKYKEKLK